MDHDPRSLVAEPVRRALTVLMVRGLLLAGAVSVLAVLIVAAEPDAAARDALTIVAIALVLGYAVVARILRVARGRPPDAEREVAWDRARELDRDDAALALLVAAWVPAIILFALVVLLWPHVTDKDPKTASTWAVFGVAAAGAAWLAMMDAWMDAARDDLARAERESDVRFRSYWANLRR